MKTSNVTLKENQRPPWKKNILKNLNLILTSSDEYFEQYIYNIHITHTTNIVYNNNIISTVYA